MIYVYKEKPADLTVDNDKEFANITYQKVLRNNRLKALIEEVEEAKFVSDTELRTKFTNVTDMLNISSGCKTLLNIIANPDKVHSIIECGCNITEFIYRENTGRIYCEFMPPTLKCEAQFKGVSHGVETPVYTFEEMERWMDDEL